jgi:hypothetical protein
MKELNDFAQDMTAACSEAVSLLAKVSAEIATEIAKGPPEGERHALLSIRSEVESAGSELSVAASRCSVIASRSAALAQHMEKEQSDAAA